MLSFHQAVADDFEAVNQRILDELYSDVPLVENIGQYLIDAGGKRLRPLLVLLMSRALGYEGEQHHRIAAAIEFIHSATLLHDDVVDVSNMRRGRLTANAKWGNAPSVLVGDFLYSRAFQIMVSMANIEIMSVISNTTNIIAEGEVQQLVNAKDPDVTEESYLTVIHKKTAALFEAGCELAAIITDNQASTREATRAYGYHLGLAFQLVDDALDYSGDAETMGKNVGDDLAEGKPTLPLIYAMNHSSEAERQLIRAAIENGNSEALGDIITIIQKTGALDYTQKKAEEHATKARAQLAILKPSTYAKALDDLTLFAINRNH